MGRWLAPIAVATMVVACGSDSGVADDGEIVASVDYEVTPAEIALGDVGCGTTKSASIAIANHGGATLAYTVSLPEGSPFVLKASPSGSLNSGETATIPIDLVPTSAGDVEDLASVDINGILQQVPLRARGVGAVLVAEPVVVDFGEVRFDRTFTQPVALRNDGNAPARIDGFEGSADAMTIGPNDVTIDPGASGAFIATIAGGAVTGAPAKATFAPTVAASTPLCGPRPSVAVTAKRVNSDVTLSVADFGQQPCGTGGGATRDVVITNYALQQLTYTAQLPAGSVFTIMSGASGTVPAATPTTASTATVKIAMGATGTVLGVHEEDLALQIDPIGPPSGGARTAKMRLDVRGAIISVTPMSASLTADDKHADSQKFRFENTGNESVKLRYAVDGGKNGAAWSIDTTSQTVDPTQGRDVTVFFKALKDGPDRYDATLKVTRDGATAAVCSPLPQPKLQGNKK